MPIFTIHLFGINFSPSWYGFMYALSFLIGLYFMRKSFTDKESDTLFFATLIGVIVGGRLGYVLFYNFGYYLDHPIEILMPWKGGMSFHGGAIGVIFAWYLASKKIQKPFLEVADQLVWLIPIGLFFGRIGNFINGELLGLPGYSGVFAVTPPGQGGAGGVSYFPTPLLEGLLEGIALLLILIWRKKNIQYPGQVGVWFLGFYGAFRFIAEFFRTPDVQIGYLFGNWMTLGHIFSILMIGITCVLALSLSKQRKS